MGWEITYVPRVSWPQSSTSLSFSWARGGRWVVRWASVCWRRERREGGRAKGVGEGEESSMTLSSRISVMASIAGSVISFLCLLARLLPCRVGRWVWFSVVWLLLLGWKKGMGGRRSVLPPSCSSIHPPIPPPPPAHHQPQAVPHKRQGVGQAQAAPARASIDSFQDASKLKPTHSSYLPPPNTHTGRSCWTHTHTQ